MLDSYLDQRMYKMFASSICKTGIFVHKSEYDTLFTLELPSLAFWRKEQSNQECIEDNDIDEFVSLCYLPRAENGCLFACLGMKEMGKEVFDVGALTKKGRDILVIRLINKFPMKCRKGVKYRNSHELRLY